MLKVVDIGIYVAAPDYGQMIKVHIHLFEILEEVAAKYMQSKLTAANAK